MASKPKAGMGIEAASGLVTDYKLRDAAIEAVAPVEKLGLDVGRRVAAARRIRR